VKSIDLENRMITFDDKARPAVAGRTFSIAKNANIVIDGGAGKLAVGAVHGNGSSVSGTVQAVDLSSNSITVDATTYVVAELFGGDYAINPAN
jgi:hypothetical protein